MGFDVRFQLVDQRSIARVLAALIADHQAPPPSAFDRVPDAAARWHAVRIAWKSGHDTQAAAATCAFLVSFSAANLPAIILRNIALTHRPLRMPDELYALDVPVGSPRSLFEYLTGVRQGVLASLPERIDQGSLTGAFTVTTRSN